MILSLYIARRYLRSFAVVSAAFLAILFFVELIEQLRRFSDDGIGIGIAAGFSILQLPGRYYTILPLIALLAAIALFLSLSRSAELVALRAVGRSGLRFLIAPGLAAVAIGAAMVAVLNPLVAATAQRYDAEAAALGAQSQTVSIGRDAVWLRQSLGDEGGQVVIRATRASRDATTLYDASFLVFDPDAGPTHRVAAAEARLVPGAWELSRVKAWTLADANPEATAKTLPEYRLDSELTADRIRDAFGAPDAVPIWQLPAFIAGLERAGFSARRHQVWFQSELARPALLGAMVLMAAAFTLHHLRGRRTGILVLAAFGAGLGLFFLAHFAQVLGNDGQIPPALAAWVPPLVGALAALGRLLRLEE